MLKSPPWVAAMSRTIASPIPCPGTRSSARAPRSDNHSASPGSIPGPSSSTQRWSPVAFREAARRTSPASPLAGIVEQIAQHLHEIALRAAKGEAGRDVKVDRHRLIAIEFFERRLHLLGDGKHRDPHADAGNAPGRSPAATGAERYDPCGRAGRRAQRRPKRSTRPSPTSPRITASGVLRAVRKIAERVAQALLLRALVAKQRVHAAGEHLAARRDRCQRCVPGRPPARSRSRASLARSGRSPQRTLSASTASSSSAMPPSQAARLARK